MLYGGKIMANKKCLINSDGTVDVAEAESLSPTDGYCVFEVKACGICGSDIPRVFAGASYYYPIVLGHEFAGVVKDSKRPELIGKRACIFPILPCGECEFCKKQQWASCKSYSYYGSRRDGGMQSELLIKEENLIELPEGVSLDAGSMIEPSAVCLHAVKKGNIKKGGSVLIYGAGTIGLLSGLWARALGAAEVFFSDPDQRRIAFAEKLGFKACGECEADTVIEASGAPAALIDAIERCKTEGTIVLVGHGKRDVTIPHDIFVRILRKQLTLTGSWNSDFTDSVNDWQDSIDAIAKGLIDPEALITHRVPLENADSAFKIIGEGKEFYNKITVVM